MGTPHPFGLPGILPRWSQGPLDRAGVLGEDLLVVLRRHAGDVRGDEDWELDPARRELPGELRDKPQADRDDCQGGPGGHRLRPSADADEGVLWGHAVVDDDAGETGEPFAATIMPDCGRSISTTA